MSTETIIRNSLQFLEKEYNLQFEVINDRGMHYIYKNKFGYFEYFEWSQFQESRFTRNSNFECKNIDMLIENPKIYGKFNSKKRGFLGFFKDYRIEFWQTIAEIIKNEINKSGTLFGLKLTQ